MQIGQQEKKEQLCGKEETGKKETCSTPTKTQICTSSIYIYMSMSISVDYISGFESEPWTRYIQPNIVSIESPLKAVIETFHLAFLDDTV